MRCAVDEETKKAELTRGRIIDRMLRERKDQSRSELGGGRVEVELRSGGAGGRWGAMRFWESRERREEQSCSQNVRPETRTRCADGATSSLDACDPSLRLSRLISRYRHAAPTLTNPGR